MFTYHVPFNTDVLAIGNYGPNIQYDVYIYKPSLLA